MIVWKEVIPAMIAYSQRGFTLIELMIVILIIAILVAIAIPLYMSIQDDARSNSCKGSLRTIDGSIAHYVGSTGTWPGTGTTGVGRLVTGNFLKRYPACPAGNGSYAVNAQNQASCGQVATHTL